MAYSKGNWTIGMPGTVVTDNGEGFPENSFSGHSDTDAYGGYLIAESILKKDDAKLIAAAPVLFDALRKINRSEDWKRLSDENQQIILNALHKTTE